MYVQENFIFIILLYSELLCANGQDFLDIQSDRTGVRRVVNLHLIYGLHLNSDPWPSITPFFCHQSVCQSQQNIFIVSSKAFVNSKLADNRKNLYCPSNIQSHFRIHNVIQCIWIHAAKAEAEIYKLQFKFFNGGKKTYCSHVCAMLIFTSGVACFRCDRVM